MEALSPYFGLQVSCDCNYVFVASFPLKLRSVVDPELTTFAVVESYEHAYQVKCPFCDTYFCIDTSPGIEVHSFKEVKNA